MTETTDHAHPHGDLAGVLSDLLREAAVSRVVIDTLTKKPSFRGSDYSPAVQGVTRKARADHTDQGFGFWEFALRRATDVAAETKNELIRGALRHDADEPDASLEMDADTFAARLRAGAWDRLPPRTMANLRSSVQDLNGVWRHLPMLDLGMSATVPGSTEVTVEALRQLGLTGALLTSKRSFHFIADHLLDANEMTALLARAQLLSPIVDYRWVAHQLIDGLCRLRISTDEERNAEPHRLVARLRR